MKQRKKTRGRRIAAIFMSLLLFVTIVGEYQTVGAVENCGTEIGNETDIKPTVYLNKTAITLAPATTQKLKLKGTKAKVKWTSSNKKVASVNGSGKVTGKAKGVAEIKATCAGVEYTCMVTVAYGTHATADGMIYKDIKDSFGRTGRWFKKSIDGGKYYFTSTDGSAIYFKVIGSKYVKIDFVSKIAVSTPYFAYSVDGGKMKRQSLKNGKINLENAKVHYVRLVIDAMSEKEERWAGEAGVGIKSIKPVTKTGIVTGIKPQNPTIAFYGDSITQGVRALSMSLSPLGTSATNSYAWYCAQRLDAVPYFAGFGATGIFKTGSFHTCYNTITNFSAGRKAASFDADIVVVEHGTNDVDHFGEAFVGEYRKVLELLHKKYPDAKIMAMIPFTQLHADEIKKAAEPYKEWCTVVETSAWKVVYTDGLHPNVAGAKVVGKNLAKKIKSVRKVSTK